jgi:NAD(P)-dependent dehydrogenase (short-subunit alcohol dehydrogenase family)
MNRIENKVAVVTGGTQGLGAEIAWQFAQAGAKAILTCGRHAENGSHVATKTEVLNMNNSTRNLK